MHTHTYILERHVIHGGHGEADQQQPQAAEDGPRVGHSQQRRLRRAHEWDVQHLPQLVHRAPGPIRPEWQRVPSATRPEGPGQDSKAQGSSGTSSDIFTKLDGGPWVLGKVFSNVCREQQFSWLGGRDTQIPALFGWVPGASKPKKNQQILKKSAKKCHFGLSRAIINKVFCQNVLSNKCKCKALEGGKTFWWWDYPPSTIHWVSDIPIQSGGIQLPPQLWSPVGLIGVEYITPGEVCVTLHLVECGSAQTSGARGFWTLWLGLVRI